MSHWENSGKSDEWYTPKYIFDALGVYFDLDVASPKEGPLYVPCDKFIYENSLESDWNGFIWMNPPYGGRNSLESWMKKFVDHSNGICLVPDRTSAPWFQTYFDKFEICCFTKKIKFLDVDGNEGKSPSNGSAIMGIGEKAVNAISNSGLGILCMPF